MSEITFPEATTPLEVIEQAGAGAGTRYNPLPIVDRIIRRLTYHEAPYAANDNISAHLHPGELEELEMELEKRLESVIDCLIIDRAHDPNTRETARRVAKMYLREVFSGRYLEKPPVTVFPNTKQLDEMYIVGPITIRSACSHHLVPITGQCWIGVIPQDKLLGLSKFHRIVNWIATRPQIQEELSVQIADYIEELIEPAGLMVALKAQHLCFTWRGVKENLESSMITSVVRGVLRHNAEARAEFMAHIKG